MTRGNQRDIDRERAQKRSDKKAAGEKHGDLQKRKLTDAEAMREKQKKAEEKKQKEEEDKISTTIKEKEIAYMKKFEEMNLQAQVEEE